MRPVLLFRNSHLSFSFRGNDRFFRETVFDFGKPQPFVTAPNSNIGISHPLVLLSGNPERVTLFGIPKHLAAATRIRYSDFSYSCSPIPESNSPGTLAFLNALRGFPLTGVLFLCGFIISYFSPVVKGVFAFSYILYTKVITIFYNFSQYAQ